MKQLLIYTMLLFILVACNQQGNQTDTSKVQSVSESIDFTGTWQIIDKDNGEFTLFIRQKNDSIIGSYCAVSQGGNRMDCVGENDESFKGIITEQSAILEFESSYGGSGKATITINEQHNLEWKIISSKGEFLAPEIAVLEKENNSQINESTAETEQVPVTLKNIEDYFRFIPKEYLYPNLDINNRELIIKKFHNPPATIEGDPNWQISISVLDIKNGYMKIVTEGGGDPYSDYEIAIFKKSDNNYIVAISEVRCGIEGCTGYKINFLKYENKQWLNITSEVLPHINILDYCDKNISNEVKNYVNNYIALNYLLPHLGTDITVRLVENFEYGTETTIADKTLAAIKYNILILSWKNDKFYISKVEFFEDE